MCVEVGSFFCCSEKGLLSLKFGWVPVRWCQIGGGCVCVDDPIDKWFMNRTRTRIRASGLTCVPRHKDMCGERGGRKECVRGISERGRERRGEGGRRNDTKEKCACQQVCMKGCPVQPIKDFDQAIRQMACGPKANKMTTVLSCRNLFLIRL